MQPSVTERTIAVNGVDTEFKIIEFKDRFLVVMSDLGRIGSMIEATFVDDFEPMFDTKVLFGDRSKEGLSVLARSLIEKLHKQLKKPVVFSFGIKDTSNTHLLALKNVFLDNFHF